MIFPLRQVGYVSFMEVFFLKPSYSQKWWQKHYQCLLDHPQYPGSRRFIKSWIFKGCCLFTTHSRWFKVPFLYPSSRSLNLEKGHLTIPKRSQRNARLKKIGSFLQFFWDANYQISTLCNQKQGQLAGPPFDVLLCFFGVFFDKHSDLQVIQVVTPFWSRSLEVTFKLWMGKMWTHHPKKVTKNW